jgi:hypothetical protein
MPISRRELLIGASSGLILPRHVRAWSFGLATPPTIGLVTTGDSITGCSNDYPFQALGNPDEGDCGVPGTQAMQTYYSRLASSVPIMWRNMGISGSRLNTNGFPDLVPLCPGFINPIPASSPFKGLKMIFTTGIGSNDACVGPYGLGGYAQYAADVAACCVSVKTAWLALGASEVRLGMCTVLPRGDGTMTQADWAGYDATLTGAGWAAANGIDYIIDVNSQSQMGQWTAPSNPLLYNASDMVHPTPFGASLLAPIFLAGINSLIGLF